MAYETILVSKTEGVAIITLNRPEVLNAMNFHLTTELDQAITDAEEDDGVGAIILTGAGERAFSAGADIHEQRRDARELSPEEADRRRIQRAPYSWHIGACRKPVLGALNGLSYGGGAVLASSLDIRMGCENSRFRFLAAAYGRLNSTWTLPMQVGWPMAKELLFTARVVEAEEAYRIGLLNHLVPSEQLMDKTMEMAIMIANNHREAVEGVKSLVLNDVGLKWQEMWEAERDFMRNEFTPPGVEDAFKDFISRKGRD
jgi:enoyl-CoA hydratase/carnithine racemase